MTRKIHHAVSLFSNCGAGDVGYARAGFRFDVMAEIDPRRLEVCLLNHPEAVGIPGDLRETWPQVVDAYWQRAEGARPSLLAACPPCQGMSTARSDRGVEADPDAGMRDKRNLLVTVIAQVSKAIVPRLIVVENVRAFLTRQVRHPETKRPISAATLLIQELGDTYHVFPFVADLCHFGIPQTRKRTFLTFIHRDEPFLAVLESNELAPYPIPKHAPDHGGQPVTLREAIGQFALPSLDASSPEKAASPGWGGLHAVPVWGRERYAMVAAIPPHTGRSAWENNACQRCGAVDVQQTTATCPKCGDPLLRPVLKAKNGRWRLIHGFSTSTYSRMKSDKPAATVTTATGHIGSNNTIHPFENRLLSTLECALLQTFPIRFKWGNALERWGHTNLRAMIGEAVPPLFTRLHGKALRAVLENRENTRFLPASDPRCTRATERLHLDAV